MIRMRVFYSVWKASLRVVTVVTNIIITIIFIITLLIYYIVVVAYFIEKGTEREREKEYAD